MRRGLLALITLATTFLATILVATTPAVAWDKLGERNVADRTDRDTIQLSGHRMFSRIRICVERRPVRFYDVAVVFNNGGRQDVPVRALIRPGQCTRVVELDHAPRDVSEISFVYEAATRRVARTSTISVWGE